MKWILWVFLVVLGGLAALGGWLWLKSPTESEPLIFENAPLKSTSIPADASDSRDRERSPDPGSDTPSPQASQSQLQEKPAEPASSPTPSNTPPESTSSVPTLSLTDRLLSFGFRTPPAPRTINTIVLHSSYNASGGDAYNFEKIIGQYEQYGVGAHYIIDRGGKIYQLVRESNIAYHSGESKMPDGRKNVNDFSIGIELIGTEDSGFTDKQYSALGDLIADIKTRYKIRDIVGHSDIAPTRKSDPWKFDWKRLK